VGEGARDGVGGAPVAGRANLTKFYRVGSFAEVLSVMALLSSGV